MRIVGRQSVLNLEYECGSNLDKRISWNWKGIRQVIKRLASSYELTDLFFRERMCSPIAFHFQRKEESSKVHTSWNTRMIGLVCTFSVRRQGAISKWYSNVPYRHFSICMINAHHFGLFTIEYHADWSFSKLFIYHEKTAMRSGSM